MSTGEGSLRVWMLSGLAALMILAFGAQSASAEPATTCVKATGSGKHHTGGYTNKRCTIESLTHTGKYEKLADFSASEEQELKALLKYLKVESSGVDGKPTVKLTGANLQVASGPKEAESNGVGNVVIGADENPKAQTGSNNLVLGGSEQKYTSYGGIVAGSDDFIGAPFAAVLGGQSNEATGEWASVSGGAKNKASGEYASVTGGQANTASSFHDAISGGELNVASTEAGWIGGGYKNEIFSNGVENGFDAAIFGGYENKTDGEYAAIP